MSPIWQPELAYAARDPWIVDGVELAGVRTLLIVPMLKEDELIGAFIIYRQEIRPFEDNARKLKAEAASTPSNASPVIRTLQ